MTLCDLHSIFSDFLEYLIIHVPLSDLGGSFQGSAAEAWCFSILFHGAVSGLSGVFEDNLFLPGGALISSLTMRREVFAGTLLDDIFP